MCHPVLSALRRTIVGIVLFSGAAGLCAGGPQSHRGKATSTELAAQVEQVSTQLKNAEDNLRVVETQYTQRPEPTGEEALLRRFSDGEIQYLLRDYASASVLIDQVISDARFQRSDKYPDALFYMGDSLYQQKDYIGAQLYLRELLKQGAAFHYKEALARYLEAAGRLNDFAGIDDYVRRARELPGGMPPDLSYAWGKWLFKRTDLEPAARIARTAEVLGPLAQDETGPYHLQATYFLGVIEVQRAQAKGSDYGPALEQFRKIAQATAGNPTEVKVKELANLSLGRLYYEAGRYDEALDRYQEIAQDSENFADSLYEIAWVHVKKQQWELARNATEFLLPPLASQDSPLAPEAQILQGHLLLKLQRYEQATDAYNKVLNTYEPVFQDLDARLKEHPDLAAYFNEQLARDHSLDVTSLLPEAVRKYASTQGEVAEAMRTVKDLEVSRRGVGESQELAARILKALDERGMEAFPALQEGYTRADGVDTALAQAEQVLGRLEGYLVENQLTPEEKAQYDALKGQVDEYRKRFASVPTTPAEVAARKQRMQERIDEVNKEASKLTLDIQSQRAIRVGLEVYIKDTRADRHNTPEEEKSFLEQLNQSSQAVEGYQKELDELLQALALERASADAVVSGEEELRQQYVDLLRKQHALLAAAEGRLPEDGRKVLTRAHEVRQTLNGIRDRVTAAKTVLKERLVQKNRQIREKVQVETRLLAEYGAGVDSISENAHDVVGRIAFAGFKRVYQQFDDLLLKSNVGLVDVAFTRKQDKTTEIQQKSSQKDHDLRALDEEFKEVLKDVD